MTATKKKAETSAEVGFSTALAELESILERIDSDEVDIDKLAAELGKAASLLEICRSKIRRAEVEVSQIVQRLEADEGSAKSEEDPEEPPRC